MHYARHTKVLSFARLGGACGVNGLRHAKDACESEGDMSDPDDPIIAKLRSWGVPGHPQRVDLDELLRRSS